MYRAKQMSRTSVLATLPVVAALMLIMILMSSCASGQSSSVSASSSTNSASGSSVSASASAQSVSSPSQDNPIDKSAFVGTWNMVDMEKDGIRVSEANPGIIPTMSEENYLNVGEDGFYDLLSKAT